VVCTGALAMADDSTGRIERMSVKKAFRKRGLGKRLMRELEILAQKRYQELILETNNDWISAISFYSSNGYTIYLNDDECTHFVKKL
jgi:ribosomal protein S18 acetylase RimI-like enzyme